MSDIIGLTREDGIGLVTLNRPEVLNAMSAPLMDELPEILRDLADDSEVACVILTGAGRGFCAGGDLKSRQAELDAEADLPEAVRSRLSRPDILDARLRARVEASRLLHDMPKPTIAMINGPCAGAGLSLAGACDLRFAAESAVFTSAFTSAGLSGDYGGSYFWTKILGTAAARELYLLPDRISAVEAKRRGLVQRLFADADLQTETTKIARRFCAGPAWAYAYAKRNLNLAEHSQLDQVLQSEVTTMGLAARITREAGQLPSAALKRDRSERA